MKAKGGGGGGFSGFFKRFYYALKLYWIGTKMNMIEIFTPHRKFDLKKVPRRPGEVAVITGGARGIGLEVVKKLLILDMHVIVGCRNKASGTEVIEEFRKKGINTGSAHIIPLDLTSLESVREFAHKVSTKYPKIHVLFNNAGIMLTPYTVTKDGYESQFQVNYLSHFLLTNLLLPNLIRAGRPGKASRIVNVSSTGHYGGFINFDDINMQLMYSRSMAYMASKLMQVVNAKDLDSKLQKEGVNVNVYAVHPGVVKTDLYKHFCIVRVFGFIFRLFYKSPEQGADGVTFTGISSKFEGNGGLYFENCKKSSVNSLAKDFETQKRLWEISCKLSGWDDTAMSDLVKQAVVSRKHNTKHEDDIVNSNVSVAPMTESESPILTRPEMPKHSVVSTSLDLDGLDDLLASYDQEDPVTDAKVEKAPKRSSSEGGKDEPRSSISTASSTGTVIENIDCDRTSRQIQLNSQEETVLHLETNSEELVTPNESSALQLENHGVMIHIETESVLSLEFSETDLKPEVVNGLEEEDEPSTRESMSSIAFESTSSFASYNEKSSSSHASFSEDPSDSNSSQNMSAIMSN